jgi:hypothetical protein
MFDESSFPSQKDIETRPAPTQTSPVVTAPNPAVQPLLPVTRAPSPTPSTDSEGSVENLIYQPRPQTPPATSVVVPFPPPNTPRTPKKECEVPHSPPSRPSATRIHNQPLSPEHDMPGSFQDRLQRSDMLREMDSAPRRLSRVPVPTRCFDGFVSTRNLRLGFAELLATAYVGRDPASFTEAMRSEDSDQWSEACQYEMDALAKNGTWELVDLPPSRRAVKSKWVFKLKVDGRYHARLVAKGFTQIPGLDFDETFSPVACFKSL